MSSPAQEGPEVPKDKEKKGLGKVLSRVRTVLKKADRRLSTLSTRGSTSAAAAAPATTEATRLFPLPFLSFFASRHLYS